MKNLDIKLMDEIEKYMEVGDNFYSIAIKMPFNNVLVKLLEGESFASAFKSQEDLINIICAEQICLDMNNNNDFDIPLMCQKIEIDLVKRILKFVKSGKNFELEDLHIKIFKNTELDKKMRANFSLLKEDISNHKSKWLMKSLVFKQYENDVIRKDNEINHEIVNRLDTGNLNLSL